MESHLAFARLLTKSNVDKFAPKFFHLLNLEERTGETGT